MKDRERVPVLAYHALDRRRSVVSTPPEIFAWQMRWLYESGFRVIRLRDLVRFLRDGDALPARAVAITFDDGFESVYTVAFPILARYGFPATVFLVPGYREDGWPGQPPSVPRARLLTWSQVREMDRHGIEFGAHTVSHPRLDRLGREEAEHEILGSKTIIEESLGHAVKLFAYPYGRYTEAAKATVRDAFSGGCATRLGPATPRSDRFALERVDAHYVRQPWLFRALSSPAFSPYLSLRRGLRAVASAVLGRPWT